MVFMNKIEKILFIIVVIGLLVVGSIIYENSTIPQNKPNKGITAWTALSISKVENIAKEWNPNVSLVLIRTSVNIIHGKSTEWAFMYCYNITNKSEIGKTYHVNENGTIFNISYENYWRSSQSIPYQPIPSWKLDSNKAQEKLFQSSKPKEYFGEDNELRISSMALKRYSPDIVIWDITLVELYSDYSNDFEVDANTGDVLNHGWP
jgi:hypothetical protein